MTVRDRCQAIGRQQGVLALALLTTCSTLAPPLPESDACQTAADCDPGEICALEQGGVCVDGTAPHQASFALRVEYPTDEDKMDFLGRDTFGSSGELTLPLDQLRQAVDIRVIRAFGRGLDNPDQACPAEYTFDPQRGYCTADAPHNAVSLHMLTRSPARLELLQQSRSSESEGGLKPYLTPGIGIGALLRVEPVTEKAAAYAQLHHILDPARPELFVPPDDLPIELVSDWRCHWPVVGTVRAARDAPDDPKMLLGGADVSFTHRSPTTNATTAWPQIDDMTLASPCSGISDVCEPAFPEQQCDAGKELCALDLAGLAAAATTSGSMPEDLGHVRTRVYAYCAPQWVGLREFDVTVKFKQDQQPQDPSIRYPYMRFKASVSLDEEPTDPNVAIADIELGKDLCVPAWQGYATTVNFAAPPIPVKLGNQVFSCCDTSCVTDVDPPTSCDKLANSDKIEFETLVANSATDTWSVDSGETDACLKPVADESSGAVGSFTVTLSSDSCDTSPCEVIVAAPTTVEERLYSVNVTTRETSVFRSARHQVRTLPGRDVDIRLRPRAVLSGRVICRPGFVECDASSAEVMAERLRVVGEEDDPPLGPFFFSQAADEFGDFALPVNPGVYIVTALPQIGLPGGPARYRVLDLRLASQGGVLPDEASELPVGVGEILQLHPGQTARVRLAGESSDARLKVRAIDFGSWFFRGADYWAADDLPEWLVNPLGSPLWSEPLDLNNPSTCYAKDSSGSVGCAIRRLTPQGATLNPTHGGTVVQFTVRPALPNPDPGGR